MTHRGLPKRQAPSGVFSVGVLLALRVCALLTAPVASEVIGGVQIAIKGAELQNEIRKADVQEAIVRPSYNRSSM
jgi:hypothetical protein